MSEFGPKDYGSSPEGELASQDFAADLRTLMSYYGESVVSYDNGDKSLTLASRFGKLEIPDTPPIEAVITESQRNSLPSLTFTIRGNNKSSGVKQFVQVGGSKPSYSVMDIEVWYSGPAWFEEKNTNNSGLHPASPAEFNAILPKLLKLRPVKLPMANKAEEQPLKQNKYVAWLGRLVHKHGA